MNDVMTWGDYITLKLLSAAVALVIGAVLVAVNSWRNR